MNDIFKSCSFEMPVIFIVDTSASMAGQRITQLNRFMVEALELIEEISLEMEIRIPVRVIEFNSETSYEKSSIN